MHVVWCFCLLILIGIIVTTILLFVDGYYERLRLLQLSERDRGSLFFTRTKFFHVMPKLSPEPAGGAVSRYASELAEEIDCQFNRNEKFHHLFQGVAVSSGLPDPEGLSTQRLIILHLQGGWPGLFPRTPSINLKTGAHANHIRSTLSRSTRMNWDHPVLAFRIPTDEYAWTNFGQREDFIALHTIFDWIGRRYSKHRFVIFAECVGALRFLNWAKTWQQDSRWYEQLPPGFNLCGLVLESPLCSMRRFVHFTPWTPINEMLYVGFCTAMVNFRQESETWMQSSRPLFNGLHVPIFIGILGQDFMSGDRDMTDMKRVLPNANIISYRDDLGHGFLFKSPKFSTDVGQFLAQLRLHPKHPPDFDLQIIP
jgi:hypothetical protein